MICLQSGYKHLATKADLYRLENRMRQFENRMIRWLGGIAIGMSILAVSVAGLFVQSLLM